MTDPRVSPQNEPAAEWVPIDSLVPWPQNPRSHDIPDLVGKIKRFGFAGCITARKANREIAIGHGRHEAARLCGLTHVPARFLDLSEEESHALALGDNETHGAWTPGLSDVVRGLSSRGVDLSGLGWSRPSMAALLSTPSRPVEDPGPPDVPKRARSKLGEVYALGQHRLACGDSTAPAVVKRLMGDERAALVVTSPPYNQGIDKFRPSGMHREGDWVGKVGRLAYSDSMPEDAYQDQQRKVLTVIFDACAQHASVFYNHKNRYREKEVVSPFAWLPGPFKMRQEIVWSRPGSVTQNARMFLPSDERIYWLYKGDDFFFDDSTEIKSWSSVWDVALEANWTHAVAFPLELPTRCIRACSKPDDIVLDPFAGSGTTIIAAAQTGRRFFGVELDPRVVDVARIRWTTWAKVANLDPGPGALEP